jgi:hypothetical protein
MGTHIKHIHFWTGMRSVNYYVDVFEVWVTCVVCYATHLGVYVYLLLLKDVHRNRLKIRWWVLNSVLVVYVRTGVSTRSTSLQHSKHFFGIWMCRMYM